MASEVVLLMLAVGCLTASVLFMLHTIAAELRWIRLWLTNRNWIAKHQQDGTDGR